MPEGDTLHRTAVVLRSLLVGRSILMARGRPGGAQLERLAGARVEGVEARGKHLLIEVDRGLTLHTRLGLHGAWHRYRPGEPWRRGAGRAVAILETEAAIAVCFDAPTVELIETRALAIHPGLRDIGPDLMADGSSRAQLVARLRRLPATMPVGEALLEQRALAGLGNVYRSEICFIERVDPFAPLKACDDETLGRLADRGRALLQANRQRAVRATVPGARPNEGRLWVYGRTGRPCRRCGTLIQSRVSGARPRRTWWCPTCQPAWAAR